MKKPEYQATSEKAWDVISKLRGIEFRGLEELADILKQGNVQFTARDLTAFGYFLATRFGRYGGTFYFPEWLAGAFSAFIEERTTKTICDPWAGAGILIGVLSEVSKAETVIALTQNQGEMALGKVLVPQADWQVGDTLRLFAQGNEELDVVASILPMSMRTQWPLNLTLPSGESVELSNDVGDFLLVASSMRLRAPGIGLFVVPPTFFSSARSVFHRLSDLGIGIEAALALPPGTFAPHTNIPTYFIVVRRKRTERMFVAQLSADANTNLQIIRNFREGHEGTSLDLGRFVAPKDFRSIEYLRASEALTLAEQRFGAKAVTLAELKEVKSGLNLGRPGDDFIFQSMENAIYIPLIGGSDVVESLEALSLKPQNYAQVIIDPAHSDAGFVARFLNSEFGKQLREQSKSGVIPRLNTRALRELRVFVPEFATQRRLLAIEAKITAEQTTVMSLQNELAELCREIWANPGAAADVEQRLGNLAGRLSGGIKQHASETLSQWFETLPFPLASILRAWQATPSHDFKTRYEHLLHFFEATSEFLSVILLSAFSSNEAAFVPHRQKLAETMEKQKLSFSRATFGTWKLVVEYFGKQTRDLLEEKGRSHNRELCADLFADPSLTLPAALSRKELAGILSVANKMRNDWSGHGGVVGQEEAQLRNQLLLAELEKLREAIADTWAETQLIHALHCRPRRGLFENEVAILMGSNSEFLKETRSMATWLDVERLYLSRRDSGRALKLLPLIQVGPSPQSAKNACYFFSRLERDGARFISYHFTDKPELTGLFEDATDTIKLLSEVAAKI